MLALWKKGYDKPRLLIKKQRHYFANKDPYSQCYGFSIVTYGCEIWTITKTECQRIDAFELWCWRQLLRVPWTARRSHQAILKEISPEYSLEELMLKLKLQYFAYLMRRADSLEKTVMLGKIEGRRRRGWQRTRSLASLARWTWVWASSRRWWRTGTLDLLQSIGSQRVRHDWTTELNSFKHIYLKLFSGCSLA